MNRKTFRKTELTKRIIHTYKLEEKGQTDGSLGCRWRSPEQKYKQTIYLPLKIITLVGLSLMSKFMLVTKFCLNILLNFTV
jgi:hypothetical protein